MAVADEDIKGRNGKIRCSHKENSWLGHSLVSFLLAGFYRMQTLRTSGKST
jgi:hypothetical protein